MTNEELAVKAKNGEDGALLELWEQNRSLAYVFASRRYNRLAAGGNMRGVELDDLMQASFLALVDAVGYFNPDKDYSFNSYWGNCVKIEFNILLGVRTSKRNPLNNCVSLDTPLSDDADADTLESTIPDQSDDFEAADDRIWREQLHEAVERALAELEPEQKQVLQLRYYDELTYNRAAEKMGLTLHGFKQTEHNALRALRRSEHRQELEKFVDLRTDFYRTGSGIRQTSPIEDTVIIRDRLLSAHSWDPFW